MPEEAKTPADEVREYLKDRGAIGHAQAVPRDLAATAIWTHLKPSDAMRRLRMVANETRIRENMVDNPYDTILFSQDGIYLPSSSTPEMDFRVCRERLTALSSPLLNEIRDLEYVEKSFKPEPSLFDGEGE